jgi:membrane-associated protein
MNYLAALIIKYRYPILFPIAAFEGPVTSLIAGFLIRLGYLSIIPTFTILFFGDAIPDTICYYLGRYGSKANLIEKYGHKLNVTPSNFQLIENLWKNHPKKTMFFSKLAYGLSTAFLISAGLAKMPFRRFIAYTISMTFFQYGTLMITGYYLGRTYEAASQYVHYIGIGITAFILAFLYVIFSRYAKEKLKEMESQQ